MAEKITVDIEVNAGNAGQGVGTLKQQLKEATLEAQALAAKFGSTSKEAINAAQRTANLREEIADVGDTINALNPEAKFNAVLKVGQGLAGGFAAAQGAMALFGAESEDVQKALLKVQAAMALSQGLNDIRGLQDGFKNLGIVVRSSAIYTRTAMMAQAAYNFVIGTSTGALKVFRLALASTGIGAIVVGVGLLIANWGRLTDYIEKNAEAFKKWGLILARILLPPLNISILLYQAFQKLGEKFEVVGDAVNWLGNKFSFLKEKIVELLTQVGVLSTSEEKAADARVEQSKAREGAIKREIELAKAQGASAEELAALEVKLAREKFLAYDQYIKARQQAGRSLTQDELQQYQDLQNALKVSKVSEQKAIEDANTKQIEENRKLWEKKKEQQRKAQEEQAKLALEYQDLQIANIQDIRERELMQLEVTFRRKMDAIKGQSETEKGIRAELAISEKIARDELLAKFAEEDRIKEAEKLQLDFENRNAVLDAQKLLEEEESQAMFDLEREQAQLLLDKQLADDTLSNEQKLLAEAQFQKAWTDIDKKEAEKRLAEDRRIREAKIAIAKGTLNALNSFADVFIKDENKRSGAKKAIALAQIAIDTAVAIAGAVKSAQTIPYPGNILAVVTGVGTVLANIASAKKILGESSGGESAGVPSTSGGGGGLGGGGNGVAPPRLTSTDSPRTQLTTQEKEFNFNIKANVVETEMTDTQNRVKNINDKATI